MSKITINILRSDRVLYQTKNWTNDGCEARTPHMQHSACREVEGKPRYQRGFFFNEIASFSHILMGQLYKEKCLSFQAFQIKLFLIIIYFLQKNRRL